MKKLLFWMVLIVGIVALIGSCAKKDEFATATATLSAPPVPHLHISTTLPLPGVSQWGVIQCQEFMQVNA